MATVVNKSKNNATVTNKSRSGTNVTWNEAVYTWNDSKPSTWNNQRTPVSKSSKNSTTVVNQNKN